MKVLSIVIPCYNESSPLLDTYREIKKTVEEIKQEQMYDYELIFVDDGSVDDTFSIVSHLAEEDNLVNYLSFSRNFGKEAGMLAGLEHVRGDVIVIMDADLQHPPSLIKQMITEYEKGFDQVIAKRSRTGEKMVRKQLTHCYYAFVNKLIDVELTDGIGDFRLLSRKAVNSILAMPETNRFSKGLFSWIGYKKKVIEYENNERVSGESKWSFRSLLNYAVDGVVSFNSAPLRVLIYLGLVVFSFSLLYIVYNFIHILLHGVETAGYFTLISSVLMLGGIQLIAIGVIGEYVGRIFYEVKRRPKYIIDKTNIDPTTKRGGR